MKESFNEFPAQEYPLLTAEDKILFHIIYQLEEPLLKIVNTLYADISSGKIQLILGDDASGRIPALILNSAIRHIYENHNYTMPDVRFIAGAGQNSHEKRREKENKINSFIADLKSTLQKEGHAPSKTLVVTDVIATGNSLRPLMSALKTNKMNSDVAVVRMYDTATDIGDLQREWKATIADGEGPTDIYKEYRLGGVHKNLGDLFARSIIKDVGSEGEDKVRRQQLVNAARERCELIGQRIARQFQAQEQLREQENFLYRLYRRITNK